MEFTEQLKDLARNRDYYERVSPNTWCDCQRIRQVKIQGDYPEIMPECTVLIRTYKRPEIVKRAIDSVLNQDGYNDYIIVVVDSDYNDLNVETETQRSIESYNNNKILYFRYDRPRPIYCNKMNAAANLVKTKFFVFLNDDDVLHRMHLKIMLRVMKSHPHIDALMCSQIWLRESLNESISCDLMEDESLCRSVGIGETIMSLRNNTTGVVYKTDFYRSFGGLIERNHGGGDVIMANRCSFFGNQYWLNARLHGIYISASKSQASRDLESYYRSFYIGYFWRLKSIQKCFGLSFFVSDAIAQRKLHKSVEGLYESWGDERFSEDRMFELIGKIPWQRKNPIIKKFYNAIGRIWDKYIDYTVKQSEEKGFYVKLTDI